MSEIVGDEFIWVDKILMDSEDDLKKILKIYKMTIMETFFDVEHDGILCSHYAIFNENSPQLNLDFIDFIVLRESVIG